MEKTKLGLTQNIEGALSYLFGPITGIIFLIFERENKFISFHALQSFIYFGILCIASLITGWIPFLGSMIGSIISIISFISWIFLMVTAFKGQTFKIPVIGDVVWNQINK